MINIMEVFGQALRGEGLTLEATVKATDVLLEASHLVSQESVGAVYNSLAIVEDAIVFPAVYSAISKDQQITQPFKVFSKFIEVPLNKVEEAMFIETHLADGTISRQATGVEAYVMVTNLAPSAFPTVDLGVLANAILAYNVDYKRSELTEIVTSGYCLANIQENRTVFLTPEN